MQKRILIGGAPFWVGVYNEPPGDWVAIGEVGGISISVTGDSESHALDLWRNEAEASRRNSSASMSPI
jgi:hypothetical protein